MAWYHVSMAMSCNFHVIFLESRCAIMSVSSRSDFHVIFLSSGFDRIGVIRDETFAKPKLGSQSVEFKTERRWHEVI